MVNTKATACVFGSALLTALALSGVLSAEEAVTPSFNQKTCYDSYHKFAEDIDYIFDHFKEVIPPTEALIESNRGKLPRCSAKMIMDAVSSSKYYSTASELGYYKFTDCRFVVVSIAYDERTGKISGGAQAIKTLDGYKDLRNTNAFCKSE